MLEKCMIFCIDLLLPYTSNIMNFTSLLGGLYIELYVYQIKVSGVILDRK